jgi:hypothetical protein
MSEPIARNVVPTYPDEHVDQILADIQSEFTRHNSPSLLPVIPGPEDLQRILRTCFFASLSRDEGRETRFRLLYHPLGTPQGTPTYAGGEVASDWIPFHPPLELTVGALVKAAHASHPRASCIVVGGTPGDPLMLGILRHQRGPRQFIFRTLSGITIEVAAPGELLVGSRFKTHMRYARGNADFPKRWQDLDSVVAALKETFEGLNVNRFMGTAMELLEAIRDNGHGGLVLISSTATPSAIGSSRYGAFNTPFLRQAWERRERLEPEFQTAHFQQVQDQIDYYEACEFAARLTAIDGALVMTHELDVLGIGSFVVDLESEVKEIGSDDSSAGPARVVFPGARHQAAARFCGGQQGSGAAALAVSHDGGLTLFVKPPDATIVTAFRGVDFR